MRSAVNCPRENCRPKARARACARVVLPTPGTSSISRCPPASRQATQSRTCAGFPTITVLSWSRSVLSCCRASMKPTISDIQRPPRQAMGKTGYFTHPDCRRHDMGRGHPECPERLDAIEDRLLAARLLDVVDRREAPLASTELLALAHERMH